jgi:NADPH-dependent glutamate synthase beta subunit-like oxidoreductase
LSTRVIKFKFLFFYPHSFDRNTKKPFLIGCKKIVLANGTSDLANRLGVRGENKSLSWLKYELPSLENAIKSVKNEEKVNSKPVLIVGAGLSAADAVIACRNLGIKVIHVFRSLTGGFVS